MKTKVITELFGDKLEVDVDEDGDVRLKVCGPFVAEATRLYYTPDGATELIDALKKARRAARKAGA